MKKNNIWLTVINRSFFFFPVLYFIRIFLLITLIIPFTANALNWENGFGAKVSTAYNDNYGLSVEDTTGVSSSKLGLYASSTGESEVNKIQLKATLNSETYSGNSLADHKNASLLFNWAQSGERLQKKIGISYSEDPTIETEFFDTGLIVDSTRQNLNFSLGGSYNLSERNSISTNLQIKKISYDTSLLNEYRNTALSMGWNHKQDEKSSISLNANLGQYKPDNVESTDNNSISASYNLNYNESTQLNFQLGMSDVKGPTSDQQGSNFSFRLNKRTDESINMSLTLSKSYQASGLGFVQQQDNLLFNWSDSISEKINGSFNLSITQTDNRDYFTVQPTVNYNLDKHLLLTGSYQYRHQNSEPGDADSNKLLFTLSYQL